MNTITNDLLNISPSYLVDTIVKDDCIELIYKQESYVSGNWNFSDSKIFKIVYSCNDGQWDVSERIYGKIIKATKESYEF